MNANLLVNTSVACLRNRIFVIAYYNSLFANMVECLVIVVFFIFTGGKGRGLEQAGHQGKEIFFSFII